MRNICLLLFTFLFVSNIRAADKKDSLINLLSVLKEDSSLLKVYDELSYTLRKNNPSLALKYAEDGVALAEKINSLRWKCRLYNNMAVVYRNLDNFDKALPLALKAHAIATQLNDIKLLCITNNSLGSIYNITGDLGKAQTHFLNFLTAAEKTKDQQLIARALGNLGNLYDSQKKYRECLKYSFRSLAIKEKIGTKEDIAGTCNNIGLSYSGLHQYDSANYYHSRALTLWTEIGDMSGMANSYNNIGHYFQVKKNYAAAINCQNKALNLQKELGDSLGMIYSYKNISEVYIEKKDFAQALKYCKTASEIATEIGVIQEETESFWMLSSIYESLGDYKNSLLYQKKYIQYKDSVLNEKSNQAFIEMQTKYDTEKKEKELTLQKSQIEKKDLEASQHKTQRTGLIIGISLLLLLAIIIFRSLQQNKKAKYIIEQQKHKVDEAYEELNQQNEEIAAQRDEIEKQKDIVEEHQKETLDSIHYAKRIQRALLTSNHYIQKHLSEFFILYKPKDIVSGDFYWTLQKGDSFFVAVADCTGHGVPGAFMSMIGINLLNEIILERNVSNPALVLDIMREEIIRNLNPEGAEEESKDGMDMILAKFNFVTNVLEYAAANNSFYIIRNPENEIVEKLESSKVEKLQDEENNVTEDSKIEKSKSNELQALTANPTLQPSNFTTLQQDPTLLEVHKADKMPVGKYHDKVESFTKQIVQLQKGDSVYLITDGFADQFGGPKGKKFKYKQLEDILMDNTHLSMSEQQNVLDKKFEDWRGNLEQVDDVTLFGIKI